VQLPEAVDDAVDVANVPAFVGDAQTGGLSEQRAKVQAVGFMHEFDFKFVGLVDFFSAGECVDPERCVGRGLESEGGAGVI